MKELIAIESRKIGKAEINSVDARELYKFLESKQEFASWIKNRIKRWGFTQDIDFTSFDKIIKREIGSTVRKEYVISVDMAKELAMVESNEKGKQARRYFIECQKELDRIKAHPLAHLEEAPRSTLFLEMATMAEDKEKLEAEIVKQKPLVDHAILDHSRKKNLADTAAELKNYVKGVNRLNLPKFLRDYGVLYYHMTPAGNRQNRVAEDYKDIDWFYEEESLRYDLDKHPIMHRKAGGKKYHAKGYALFVTMKGKNAIKKLLLENGFEAEDKTEPKIVAIGRIAK